jgi:hypothetical protein
MGMINIQIDTIISEIEMIADYLYQQKISDGYSELNKTISEIMDLLDKINIYKKEDELQVEDQSLVFCLTKALEAMENKDNVLLADILLYEVTESLKEINKLFI